jgi:hypothetical protein
MSSSKNTLLIMVALLIGGLAMVLLMKMMMGIEMRDGRMAFGTGSMDTGTIIVALLVPFLAYAVLSGAIEELGFGGVKAKFNHAANSVMNLPDPGIMLPSSEDFDQVGQAGPAAI